MNEKIEVGDLVEWDVPDNGTGGLTIFVEAGPQPGRVIGISDDGFPIVRLEPEVVLRYCDDELRIILKHFDLLMSGSEHV